MVHGSDVSVSYDTLAFVLSRFFDTRKLEVPVSRFFLSQSLVLRLWPIRASTFNIPLQFYLSTSSPLGSILFPCSGHSATHSFAFVSVTLASCICIISPPLDVAQPALCS